jgi:hypothetical protein
VIVHVIVIVIVGVNGPVIVNDHGGDHVNVNVDVTPPRYQTLAFKPRVASLRGVRIGLLYHDV